MIVGGDEEKCRAKEQNVRETDYSNIVEVRVVPDQRAAQDAVRRLKGEVVIITDVASRYLKDTITNVVAPFSESYVGCVCGMVRKAPDENGDFHDGANWRYENKIKVMESNIGCLSGANTAICAFRRGLFPERISTDIHLDFYYPTAVTEIGFDVLFEPNAVAYEGEDRTEQELFEKHIDDGASGYRAMARFRTLLWPKSRGSFVFWSHRVMKWLVPFNLICMMVCFAWIGMYQSWALVAEIALLAGMAYLAAYNRIFTRKGKNLPGIIGKLSDFGAYFFLLNVAYLFGFFRSFKKQ